jgi:hypothetical protein
MVRGWLRSLLLASLVAGCFLPTEPPLPDGIAPFEAPPQFARWWSLVESCSGHTGAFANVQWYVVPGAAEFTVDGKRYQGYTWNQGDRIVLADGSRLDGTLVRHEMLHALTGKGHPASLFRERCGGIVACATDCAASVGEPYDAPTEAPVVSPSELQLAVATTPGVISASTDSGWATIVVSVTNPHPFPLWVRLDELAPGYGTSRTFGFELYYGDSPDTDGHAVYTYTAMDRIAFRAGETRRYAFDFRAWAGLRICGWFNSVRTDLMSLVVVE